jgi:hypothetical protein
LRFEQAGSVGPSIAFDGLSTQQNFANAARGFVRIAPTVNLINDTIWTKQKHTIQGGINFRFINNDRSNFSQLVSRATPSAGTRCGAWAAT